MQYCNYTHTVYRGGGITSKLLKYASIIFGYIEEILREKKYIFQFLTEKRFPEGKINYVCYIKHDKSDILTKFQATSCTVHKFSTCFVRNVLSYKICYTSQHLLVSITGSSVIQETTVYIYNATTAQTNSEIVTPKMITIRFLIASVYDNKRKQTMIIGGTHVESDFGKP